MSLPSLNTVCYDPKNTMDISMGVESSPEAGASRRFKSYGGRVPTIDADAAVGAVQYAKEQWRVSFSVLTPSDFTTLKALFASVKYSACVAWTPPGESTPRAFRFTKWVEVERSSLELEVTAELLAIPDVDT